MAKTAQRAERLNEKPAYQTNDLRQKQDTAKRGRGIAQCAKPINVAIEENLPTTSQFSSNAAEPDTKP
ncbi:hypothetical protein HY994_01170 [Candidatus Micrarchaeota archaeon]|nr:hypothetical protein [Candidatus Micrarchaeota archaeon]